MTTKKGPMMRSLTSVVLISGFLAGCAAPSRAALQPATPTAIPESPCSAPRRVIVGLDRSGSYTLVRTALEVAAQLVERSACPGDMWFLRWIEADSYPTAAAIRTISFAQMPPRPQPPGSPVERAQYFQQLALWQATASKFAQQKREAGRLLRQDAVTTSDRTDIVGFLVKADELLANTPTGVPGVIIMATDLEDNVGQLGPYDLRGAAVLVVAFEGTSAQRTRELRQAWEQQLTAAHASTIVYRDATEPGIDSLDALRSIPSTEPSPTRGGTQ